MKKLKSGYTTGACATACVKAALLAVLDNKNIETAEIEALNGETLKIPIKKVKKRKNSATAVVEKYSGDDPDVTNGIDICVKIKILEKNREFPQIKKGYYFNNILIYGGYGVGVATKKGLQCPVGKSAINTGPLKMIENTAVEIIQERNIRAEIIIYIPSGKEKAKKTFNEKLGVIGGLSVLGSTGILNPMSEEALKNSLYTELKVLKENRGGDFVIFSFGNHGKKYCEEHGLNTERIIVMSNYVGFMLESAAELGFKKIFLVGHIGKAVKIAGGIYNTHSRTADCRMEIMGANAFLIGESYENIMKILKSNTVEEACEYVEKKELFNLIADKAAQKSKEYVRDEEIECEVMLFAFSGKELGHSKGFYKLLNEVQKSEED